MRERVLQKTGSDAQRVGVGRELAMDFTQWLSLISGMRVVSIQPREGAAQGTLNASTAVKRLDV